MATDSAIQYGVFSIPLHNGVSPARGPRLASGPGPLREFIAGPENSLLPIAVNAVFEQNLRYSPLCIFGGSGLGKSHLATGLVDRLNEIASRKTTEPKRVARRIAGADFARDVTDALQTDSLVELRSTLAGLDLLVLDNLEEIAPKPHAQRELCVLIDAFAASRTILITTSRTSPAESNDYSNSLTSRLTAGLLLPIERPGEAARRIYLETFAEHAGQVLGPVELKRLVDCTAHRTPREIQGLFTEYSNFLLNDGAEEEAERVERFLQLHMRPKEQPTLKQIAAQTARLFRVTQRDLCGPTRRQAVVKARGVAMFVARKLNGDSLDAIGKHFGNRDHTTVMHACKRTEALLEDDPIVSEAVEKLLLHWSD